MTSRWCTWSASTWPRTILTLQQSSTPRCVFVNLFCRPLFLPPRALISMYFNQAYSAVLLQHEFGIFGGVHGEFVLELLRPLRRPVMSTLHTVEAHASQVRLAVATQVMLWSTAAVTLAGDGCRAVGSWAHAYGTGAYSFFGRRVGIN